MKKNKTPDYDPEFVKKLLKLKSLATEVVPADEKGFMEWLHNNDIDKIEKEEPTILYWYKVNDSGEFVQEEGEDYYPQGYDFKYIDGLFTILDENGYKKLNREI